MNILLSKKHNPHFFSDDEIVIKSGREYISCPFHEDNDPSLSFDMEKGCFKCFGCGISGKVMTAADYEESQRIKNSNNNTKTKIVWEGIDLDDLDDNDNSDENNNIDEFLIELNQDQTESRYKDYDDLFGNIENSNEASKNPKNDNREHIYVGQDGQPTKKKIVKKNSSGKKQVFQQYYNADQKIWQNKKPSNYVEILYNLQNLINNEQKTIIYVEGEKDVDTICNLGFKSVTTKGSCSDKLTYSDVKFLKDHRIIILPDEDQAGYKYARDCAKTLFVNGIKEVFISFLPNLEEYSGQDVSDFIEVHKTDLKDFKQVVEENLVRFDNAQQKLSKYDGQIALSFEELMSPYKSLPTECLPEVIRNYIKLKSSVDNSNVDYHFLGLIAAFGTLVASKYQLKTHGEWYSNTSFNLALVGTTGQSKSHPLRDALKRIVEYNRQQNDCYNSKLKEYENYINQQKKGSFEFDEKVKKPEYKPYMLNKFTMEGLRDSLKDNPKGILLYVDELRGLFNSLNQYKGKGDDVETLMLLIDGQDVNIKLASGHYYIKKPKVSVIGTIQPEILKKCFDRETKDNGLAFRFLFACPEKKKFTLKEIDKDTKSQIGKATKDIESLMDNINECNLKLNEDGTADPITINFNKDAKDIFFNFINIFCHDLEDIYSTEDLIDGILAKIKTYYPKIALLIHLIRYHSGDIQDLNIDKESMDITDRLIKYFIYHNYLALRTTGNSNLDSYYTKLKEFSSKKGGKINARDINVNKVFGKDKKSDSIKRILEELSDKGKIKLITEGKSMVVSVDKCRQV